MNKKFENIIIDGDVRNIFTACYSKEDAQKQNDCTLYRFTSNKLPCTSSEVYAKDTNALYILNRYLAKIIENKEDYIRAKFSDFDIIRVDAIVRFNNKQIELSGAIKK